LSIGWKIPCVQGGFACLDFGNWCGALACQRWWWSMSPKPKYSDLKRHQRRFYSGKKKRHSLKCQLVIEQASGRIICTFFGKGRRHDFKLFQAEAVHFHPQSESLPDKGYQGIQKLHANSCLPKKKPRGGQLGAQDKAKNRQLAVSESSLSRSIAD
jgi:hypothetical protein